MSKIRYTALELKDGKPVKAEPLVKLIDPTRCPHYIIMGEHYREDGSCKCDDPNEKVMAEWGYEWRDGQWHS